MTNILSKIARRLTGQKESSDKEQTFDSHQNPPDFSPNNSLEHLLIAAAADPSIRREFNRELLTHDLFVATPEAPHEVGQRILEEDEVLQILNVSTSDGVAVPAVFSSEQRLAECFGTGAGYVAMKGVTLLEILQKSGAALNPASAYGVRWTPDDLASILGRAVARTVQKGTRITLGAPASRPDMLIAELTEALDRDARVEEAWLALAHWADTDEWSWYLDVRSNSPADEISPHLADACRPEFRDGKPLDIVVNPPTDNPGVGIRVKPQTSH